jgi:hypothetical protein
MYYDFSRNKCSFCYCISKNEILNEHKKDHGKIKSKCDEASKLLEESQDLTVRLLDELKNLHMIQTTLCLALNVSQISFRTLGSIASVGGEALVALLARNIPNIEKSSKKNLKYIGAALTIGR